MPGKLTRLKKPLTRLIGRRLVVRISKDGIWLRGYRRRTWQRVDWQRVASLFECNDSPILVQIERERGARELRVMGAVPPKEKD